MPHRFLGNFSRLSLTHLGESATQGAQFCCISPTLRSPVQLGWLLGNFLEVEPLHLFSALHRFGFEVDIVEQTRNAPVGPRVYVTAGTKKNIRRRDDSLKRNVFGGCYSFALYT